MILPLPSLHSRMKAAEQRSDLISLMYDPSVTAMHEPALIECSSQLSSPTKRNERQSQVFPQSASVSSTVLGEG